MLPPQRTMDAANLKGPIMINLPSAIVASVVAWFIVIPSSALAARIPQDSVQVFMSGDELKELCMAFKEALDNNYSFKADEVRQKESRVGILMGYVSGIYDANAEALVTSTLLSREQLMAVVSKYVLDHPEEWHLPGRKLVLNALDELIGRPRSVRRGGRR